MLETVPPDEVVLYADEVDIHLNPKIDQDWMPRGVQKCVRTSGKNEQRYLAGALDPRTGKVTYVEGSQENSDLFIHELWTLAKRDSPDAKRIHIIHHNYRIQTKPSSPHSHE